MEKKSIRQLVLSTYDKEGGASRSTFRIFEALRNVLNESRMLVQFKSSIEPSVIAPDTSFQKIIGKIRTRLDLLPLRKYKNFSGTPWRYRELFYFLSWRDILVRYKQTVIGVAWSVIRPILTMVVFTIIFGKIAKLPSENAPYAVLVFVALLPWQFFANALQESSNSLISNANMISKIYFPRIIMPISSMIVALVDFFISFVLLAIIMVFYRFAPSWKIVFMPVFLLLAILVSTGAGLLISALNVRYRDFRYIVPFIIQFGLYISPVGFSSDTIPGKWRLLYSINPMVGVIDGFRWSIIGKGVEFYMPGLIISIVLTIILFVVSIIYFRKTEKTFADRI